MKNFFMVMFVLLCLIFNINFGRALTIGNQYIVYTDTSEDEDINLGDVVCIFTECFYVLDINEEENTVRLFPQKNVDGETFLQSDEAGLVTLNMDQEYSSSLYDDLKMQIQVLSDNYANKIYELSGIEVTAAFMSATDYKNFTGEDVQVDQDLKDYDNIPSWLYDTDYVIGNFTQMSIGSKKIAMFNNLENGVFTFYSLPEQFNIRPLVTMSLELLETNTITANGVNGSIHLANDGFLVTITLVPDDGYELSSLDVTTDNYIYSVNETDNKTYTFMFDKTYGDVTVTAIFTKIEEELIDPNVDNNVIDESNIITEYILENPQTTDNIIFYVLIGFGSFIGILIFLNLKHYLKITK